MGITTPSQDRAPAWLPTAEIPVQRQAPPVEVGLAVPPQAPPTPAVPRPRQPRPVATYVIAAGLAVGMVGGIGAVQAATTDTGPPAAGSGGYVANVSVPGRVLTSFGDGTWQVGVDVEPGTYTTTGAGGPTCRHALGRTRTGARSPSTAAHHRRADGGGRVVRHGRMRHVDAHRLSAHPGVARTFDSTSQSQNPPCSSKASRSCSHGTSSRHAHASAARSVPSQPRSARPASTACRERRALSAVERQRGGGKLVVVVVQLVLPQVVVPEPVGAGRVAETAGDAS